MRLLNRNLSIYAKFIFKIDTGSGHERESCETQWCSTNKHFWVSTQPFSLSKGGIWGENVFSLWIQAALFCFSTKIKTFNLSSSASIPLATNLVKLGYTLSLLFLRLKSCLDQSNEHALICFWETTRWNVCNCLYELSWAYQIPYLITLPGRKDHWERGQAMKLWPYTAFQHEHYRQTNRQAIVDGKTVLFKTIWCLC